MKDFYHPFVWMVGILFLTHQFTQHILEFSIPIMDDYFDPFCLGAICIYLLQKEHQFWFDKSSLSWIELIIAIGFLAFMSEYVFPKLSSEFTADWVDVIAIALGGIAQFTISRQKQDLSNA